MSQVKIMWIRISEEDGILIKKTNECNEVKHDPLTSRVRYFFTLLVNVCVCAAYIYSLYIPFFSFCHAAIIMPSNAKAKLFVFHIVYLNCSIIILYYYFIDFFRQFMDIFSYLWMLLRWFNQQSWSEHEQKIVGENKREKETKC